MDEGSLGGSLLSDVGSIRMQLEAIKDRLERGPAWLKMACGVICAAAFCCDLVSLLSEMVTLHPFQMINTSYAAAFALLGVALELQQAFFVGIRRWLNVWMKLLNRTWGKGVFYILTAGLHLSAHSTVGYVLGVLLLICGVAAIGISRSASGKLSQLHAQIVKEHTQDLVYVRQVFNRMDTDNTGHLSSAELASACKELGSEFHPNELVAIFDYLDADFDGKLSYEEFEAFWTGKNVQKIAWERIPII